jgi:hypothetical protein
MQYLKDLIKGNNHKLVKHDEAKTGYIYLTVFDYCEKYGTTFDGHNYYNNYYVETN